MAAFSHKQTRIYHTHECTNNETWVDKYGQGCDMYEAAPDACGTAVLHADEVMYYEKPFMSDIYLK